MGFFELLNKDLFAKTALPHAQAESVRKATTLSFPNTVPLALSGLNLQQVLDAHTAWKSRLVNIIEGTSLETPDIAAVSRDNACFLGKWIYSEGQALYGHLPEFELVREVHAEFHCCAGEVLSEHLLGSTKTAETLLKTKFRKISNKNQLALTSLFTKAIA
jgi:Chemoreceptor zinc-binding domain